MRIVGEDFVKEAERKKLDHIHADVIDGDGTDNPARLRLHTVVVYEFMLCSAVSVAMVSVHTE